MGANSTRKIFKSTKNRLVLDYFRVVKYPKKSM